MREKTQATIVVGIAIAVAVVFRFFPSNSGLPDDVFFRNDELNYAPRVASCLRGACDIDYFINPSFSMYLVAGVAALRGVSGVALGRYESFRDFAITAAVDPSPVVTTGRYVSMFAGVTSVVLIYLCGSRLLGRRAGVIAALALATNETHAARSVLLGNEVVMVSLVLASFLALLWHLERPSAVRLGLSGAFLGLAAATKYNAGVHLVTLLLGVAWGSERRGWWSTLRQLVFLGATTSTGFLLGSPSILLHPVRFVEDFRLQSSFLHTGWAPGRGESLGWRYYLEAFPAENNGWPFAWVIGVGLVVFALRAICYRDRTAWLLLAAGLPSYLILGSGVFFIMRFLLPAIPFALLVGAGVLELGLRASEGWFQGAGRARVFIGALVAGVLLTLPAIASHQQLTVRFGELDRRHGIARWMLDRVDPSHPILILAEPPTMRLVDRHWSQGPHALRLEELGGAEKHRYERLSGRRFEYVDLQSQIASAQTLPALWAQVGRRGLSTALVIMNQSRFQLLDELPLHTRNPSIQDCRYWGELIEALEASEVARVTAGGVILTQHDLTALVGLR